MQYSPRSNARFAVEALVSKNVADSVSKALSDLEGRVGDIDDFVARELGHSVDDMLGTDSKRGNLAKMEGEMTEEMTEISFESFVRMKSAAADFARAKITRILQTVICTGARF